MTTAAVEVTTRTLVSKVAALEAAGTGPSGPAGGVLAGTYPNPGFALDMATQAELDAHAAATNAHGIADTALLVLTSDGRLTNTRTPTDGSVTDAKVSASAAIAESKLALASDAAAGTASRRTLGTGAAQAAPGTLDAAVRRGMADLGDVVAPYPPALVGGVASTSAYLFRSARCMVPKSGTLHDLYVWVGTSSGNIQGYVYDTGDATGTSTWTQLWAGSSTALAGTGVWFALGDPGVAVTRGQVIQLCFIVDNATATFGRITVPTATMMLLPTGFSTLASGAAPLLFGGRNMVNTLTMPSTITTGSIFASGGNNYFIMARVS